MRFLLFVLTIATGLFVPAGAGALLSLLGLKNSLVQFALEQISVPGSLEITVEKVEDVADGATDLVSLAVADGDGVWLRVERVSMAWMPTRLLKGELAITKLTADKVNVLRAPKPGPDQPEAAVAEDGVVEIKWPRAPLTVAVDGLRLTDVTIAEGVAGPQSLAFNAEGSVHDEGDVQSATFALTRTDTVTGDIRLEYRRDFKEETLRLALDANEAAGGLVAALASLPPGSAAKVQLKGDGPVLDWRGDLQADIGNLGRLDGAIVVPSVQPAEVRLDVKVTAQGELQTAAQPLLDEPVDLKLDLRAEATGLVTLRVLDIQATLGMLSAKGTFDSNAGRLDMVVDLDVPALAAPLPPGMSVKGFHFAGQVAGLVEDLRATGKLRLAEVLTDAARVGGAEVDADIRATPDTIGFAVTGAVAAVVAGQTDVTQDGPVTLDVAGKLAGDLLTLEKADVKTALGTVAANGTFDTKVTRLDMAVDLNVPALGAPLLPDAEVKGFHFAGRASGLIEDLRATGQLRLAEAVTEAARVGGLEVNADVRITPEVVGFAVKGSAADLLADRLDITQGGPVTLDVAGSLAGEQLTLENANIASALVMAEANGSADLGGGAVDLAYRAEAADLAPIAGAYDTNADGSFIVEGRVTGVLNKPAVKGTATLSKFAMDGKPVGDVQLEHDILLAEAISGTAKVRGTTKPYGKVSADTAFRLEGDQLTVSTLQANGLGVQAANKGPMTVDLAQTLVAGAALAGAGNGSVKLSVLEGKQAADLSASITKLRTDGATVESVKLQAAVRDALASAPGLRAKVTAAGVAAGGVELAAVNVTANGSLKALDVKADTSGTAPGGKAIVADLAARLRLEGQTQTIRLTRLDASYDKEQARLVKPLTVTIQGSAVNAKGLQLKVPGGEIAGDIALAGNRLRGKILLAMQDLGRLAKLADVPVQAGTLNAQAEFDTRRSATLQAKLTGLVSDELPADAGGLDADVAVNWDDKQANATATVEGSFGYLLKLTAGVALTPSRGVLPKPNAALRGTVKWSGRMESL